MLPDRHSRPTLATASVACSGVRAVSAPAVIQSRTAAKGDIDPNPSVEAFQTSIGVADRQKLLDDFKKATEDYGLCPNRVWAVAKEDLPKLLPNCKLDFRVPSDTPDENVGDSNDHSSCTFDFCEQSQRDFTAVEQRHECLDKDSCKQLAARFSRVTLNDAAMEEHSTVWALDGVAMLEAPRPYMAISHVWSDGTGAGAWKAGQVNECLYHFFQSIAERFGCEGMWWDTVCIPEDKAARQKAIHMIQNNYQSATITLIHDCFLRNWQWDLETACFGILMSPWFSRGWTALELAKSRKVKVIFRGQHGPVIKDLDQDILAREGPPSSPREFASSLIRHLRQKIEKLNDLLVTLGSRSTSWPKDRAIISALMLDMKHDERQQETYQKILMKMGKVAPGNLFHNFATMSSGFKWCSANIWSMPHDSGTASLQILEDGDLLGSWRISRVDSKLEERCSWSGTHRLVEQRIRQALQSGEECYLLAEVKNRAIERALLASLIGRAVDGEQRYELVGAVYPHPPLNGDKWAILPVRLAGDVSSKSKTKKEGKVESLRQPAGSLHQAALTGDWEAFKQLLKTPGQNVSDSLGQLPIHIAAERGHEDMVELLATLPSSKGKCNRGQTAMHRAAWGGSPDVAKKLVEYKFDVFPKDNRGVTPLHIAAELGNEAVLEFLITRITTTDEINRKHHTTTIDEINSNSQTALHYAALRGEFDCAQLLVDAGASRHSQDCFGWTPLHCAAGSGNLDVIQLLLGGETNAAQDYVNCRDAKHGWRPIHFAAMSGNTEAVDLLVQSGADKNVKDVKGWTPGHFAEVNQHKKTLLCFTEQGASLANICQDVDNITPLHCQAMNMRQGSVAALVHGETEVPSKANSDNGWSPLIFAIEHGLEVAFTRLLKLTGQDVEGHRALVEAAIRNRRMNSLQHLILTQHIQDPQEMLSLAVDCGCASAVELLLDSGHASVADDPKPMHLAAQHGNKEIAMILLSRGAFYDGIADKRSPLSVAAEAGHIELIKLLLDKGAKTELADAGRKTPLSHTAAQGNLAAVEMLLLRGAGVEGCDPSATPLSYAAQSGHEEVVQLLLNKGAMIETRPPQFDGVDARTTVVGTSSTAGWLKHERGTPLALAARGGHVAVMEMLIDRGASVAGYPDPHPLFGGNYGTPLCMASERGHLGAVKLLMENGATVGFLPAASLDDEEEDPMWVGSDWRGPYIHLPPLSRAIKNGHVEVVELLLRQLSAVDADDYRYALEMAMKVAVYSRQHDITKLLLDKGASVDGNGVCPTALDRIVFPPLLTACHIGAYEIAELLISRGANVNMTGDSSNTALTFACENGHDSILGLLLENGANVDGGPGRHGKPLFAAIRRRNHTAVELLLQRGADFNQPGDNGRTAVQFAVSEDNTAICRLLQQHGAIISDAVIAAVADEEALREMGLKGNFSFPLVR
ncbi:hypothetical protein NQ176_g2544 [Zarea fungicola]|uniref:Uncharacterized protein n=1 Tax=Zarea fungicola TaxID=93591 RepID=A0ACC1NNC9_9HYPO|nr:hypothetical protein NQ176_g2544 [Lecanicillium fungicola]